jgi:hypothetical protein
MSTIWDETYRELPGIVWRLQDADALPGVEGTVVALALGQLAGTGLVRGGVGRAGPATGLPPLRLICALPHREVADNGTVS